MGKQGFRAKTAATSVLVGDFELTEAKLMKATAWQDNDAKIATAALSIDRVNTISAVSGGFEQKQYGQVLTTNSVDYIPVMPFTSMFNYGNLTSFHADRLTKYPSFFPFCLSQQMTLKGFQFGVHINDSGPAWVAIYDDTTTSGRFAHMPGNLVAWMKTTGTIPSNGSSALYIDDGNDGIVYNSSGTNGQVSLDAGIYWITMVGQVNDMGSGSGALIRRFTSTGASKALYNGGGAGLEVGYNHGSGMGPDALGLYYSSWVQSAGAMTPDDDDWTPPTSLSGSTSFSIDHLVVDVQYGPPGIVLLML